MAQFYSAKQNKSKRLSKKMLFNVESIDHRGKAVGHHEGKVIFCQGLLPDEKADVQITHSKARFAEAKVLKRRSNSEYRVQPECRYFEQCGGCQLQYATPDYQRELKQTALIELIQRMGQLSPAVIAEPITSEPWHYRRRARLGVRYQNKQLRFGFRQEASNEIVTIESCPVLVESLSALLQPLQQRLSKMKLAKAIGHVDLYSVNEGDVVLLRLLRPVSMTEVNELDQLATQLGVLILLQIDEAVSLLNGQVAEPLHYQCGQSLPEVAFMPGDFFQINDAVNQKMVAQAIAWLEPLPSEKGLDLFCGGGNFTFPLAQKSQQVIGVEGVPEMVQRAKAQANKLGLTNVDFYQADLNACTPPAEWLEEIDWVLLDPARAGAAGAIEWLKNIAPQRILYIACDPTSLARDGKALATQGYQLERLGLVDMFPHTHHLESMALFTRISNKN